MLDLSTTQGLVAVIALCAVAAILIVGVIIAISFAKKNQDRTESAFAEVPAEEAPKAEEPKAEPAPAPAPVAAPAPVVEKKPEPVKEEPAPAAEEEMTAEEREYRDHEGVEGDWSNYDGEYEGYYYDPHDGCYYEGEPPVYVLKMYEKKPITKEQIIKKVAPRSAPITSKPISKRAPIKKVKGFDESVIYGQYIVEHEGSEYFFTLYSNKGETLYESYNYYEKQYCLDAINRFKKHVLVGAFSIEAKDGDFYFMLKRNTLHYQGPAKKIRVQADESIVTVKYFAQTDLIREQ